MKNKNTIANDGWELIIFKDKDGFTRRADYKQGLLIVWGFRKIVDVKDREAAIEYLKNNLQ